MTADDNAQPKTVSVPVRVTYADGSSATIHAQVTILKRDSTGPRETGPGNNGAGNNGSGNNGAGNNPEPRQPNSSSEISTGGWVGIAVAIVALLGIGGALVAGPALGDQLRNVLGSLGVRM